MLKKNRTFNIISERIHINTAQISRRYNLPVEAVVVQRASLFFSTTASVLRCGVVGRDFLVVVDDAAHVRHAAVADFYVVLVKDGVQIVVQWEVFIDQDEEGFSYVGLDIFAVWGGGWGG